MKKILAAGAIALALGITFAACSDDDYSDKDAPSVTVSLVRNGNRSVRIEFEPEDSDFDHVCVYDCNGKLLGQSNAGENFWEGSDFKNEEGVQLYISSVDKDGNESAREGVAAFPTEHNKYMVAYFKSDSNGNSSYESLFLGYSEDGLNYTALNNNKYVYKVNTADTSGGACVRDCYVARLHDYEISGDGTTLTLRDAGKSQFAYLATDWTNYGNANFSNANYGTTGSTSYWGGSQSPSIIVSLINVDTKAESIAIVKPHSPTTTGSICQRLVTLDLETMGRGSQMHAWAPEMVIDYNDDGTPKPVANVGGVNYYYGIIWSGAGNIPTYIEGKPIDAKNEDGTGYYGWSFVDGIPTFDPNVEVSSCSWSTGTIKNIDKFKYHTENDVYDESGNLVEDKSTTYDGTNRTYISYTNDFITVTGPFLWFQNDYTGSVVTEIDASVIKVDGKFYMFFKNEAGGVDITQTVSSSLMPGSFKVMNGGRYVTRGEDQSTQTGVEGPWIINGTDGNWWLYGDNYSAGSVTGTKNFLGTATTVIDASAKNWVKHDNDVYSFPAGVRHAIAFRVTEEELNVFKNKKW